MRQVGQLPRTNKRVSCVSATGYDLTVGHHETLQIVWNIKGNTVLSVGSTKNMIQPQSPSSVMTNKIYGEKMICLLCQQELDLQLDLDLSHKI